MANERSNVMTPQRVEDLAREVADSHGMGVTVLAGEELLAKGLRMFHAVGQAAECVRACVRVVECTRHVR